MLYAGTLAIGSYWNQKSTSLSTLQNSTALDNSSSTSPSTPPVCLPIALIVSVMSYLTMYYILVYVYIKLTVSVYVYYKPQLHTTVSIYYTCVLPPLYTTSSICYTLGYFAMYYTKCTILYYILYTADPPLCRQPISLNKPSRYNTSYRRVQTINRITQYFLYRMVSYIWLFKRNNKKLYIFYIKYYTTSSYGCSN